MLAAVAAAGAIISAAVSAWWGPLQIKKYEEELEQTRQLTVGVASQVTSANTAIQHSSQQISELQGSSAGTLDQGQKLCRVMQNKQWKDGLIVPKSWNINLCMDYMRKTGGTKYQLGCVYTDGLTLGNEDGTIPSPNCSWN